MIDFEQVEPEQPEHGPPCGVKPMGHRWTLSVSQGELSLTSGCEECDDEVFGPAGIDGLEMNDLPGRLAVEEEHPNLGGWHGLTRCDCGWWWRFTPETGEAWLRTHEDEALGVLVASEVLQPVSDDDLGMCAYNQDEGICSYGCYDEPQCQTCAPAEGWLSERFQEAIAEALTSHGIEDKDATRAATWAVLGIVAGLVGVTPDVDEDAPVYLIQEAGNDA